MGTHISNDKDAIVAAFKEIAGLNVDDDGVRFLPDSVGASDIAIEHKYPGVRISVIGFLDTIRKELTFDIGFGDVIIPSSVIMAYPTIIEKMKSPRITAYSLETVVAEKFQTIVEKSVFNSRMKDFFDLYRIISARNFDENSLSDAIRATFENRKTDFDACEAVFSPEFMNDETLGKRWNAFCNKTPIKNPLTFQQVMALIASFVKPYCNKLK